MMARVQSKRESSYTVGGNVIWYSHYGEQYEGSIRKLKLELPYDPVKTIIWKDTHYNVQSSTIHKSQYM